MNKFIKACAKFIIKCIIGKDKIQFINCIEPNTGYIHLDIKDNKTGLIYDLEIKNPAMVEYLKEKYVFIPNNYSEDNLKMISHLETFKITCEFNKQNKFVLGYFVEKVVNGDWLCYTEKRYYEFILRKFGSTISNLCNHFLNDGKLTGDIETFVTMLNEIIITYNENHDITLAELFVNEEIKNGKLKN